MTASDTTQLERAMRKQGKTLEQIAEEVGTSASTISRWNNGSRRPRPQYLARYARSLGLTTARLMAILYTDEVRA